jgi:predicted DNA-binding transcriptional regulator AlpA
MHPTITAPRKEEEDRLMDLEEVAEKLGHISTRSVRRLIARGDLPKPVKVLSSPRLYHSDIMTYLERLKQKRETDKQPNRTKESL